LAPDAFVTSRRVSLQKALVVECLAQTVDPSPTERSIDRFLGAYRGESRPELMDLYPDLRFFVMVVAQPVVKVIKALEFVNSPGIDFERHVLILAFGTIPEMLMSRIESSPQRPMAFCAEWPWASPFGLKVWPLPGTDVTTGWSIHG